MILSMTGFGKSEAQISNKKFTVEIRALNSKNIDLNLKTPHIFRALEPQLRKEINLNLIRGKIDVSVFIDNGGESNTTVLNKTVIENYIAQLQDIHSGDTTDFLKIAVRLPDAFKVQKENLKEEEKTIFIETFSNAIEHINEYRKNEGLALEKDFDKRLEALEQLLKKVMKIDPEREERVRQKLNLELEQLTVDIDRNRMEQELIYYLEKYDITEEKVRLENHLSYFKDIMKQGSSNGKKLGFIAQEIGREINTIGSKANHSGLQRIVVQMKDELEKIKEQLLNVL